MLLLLLFEEVFERVFEVGFFSAEIVVVVVVVGGCTVLP